MAITLDYVDWATGNDYKGASFVDGAYTSATKTLTKAGAFAATKVNHWLYLESNDGGSIVAGYYRVTDVTGAPNAVVLATDAGAGVDDDAAKCTQHDGSTTLPWRSDQGACDLLTRNTTDGNQVNIKSGSAVVHAAALDLTVFVAGGALSTMAPLILRGYTATANDGGMGEIDCGGATMFAATTHSFMVLHHLQVHNGGDTNMVQLYSYITVIACEFHRGVGTPSTKSLLKLNTNVVCVNCYFHDSGTNGRCLEYASYVLVLGCFFDVASGSYMGVYATGNPATTAIIQNVFRLQNATGWAVYAVASSGWIVGNTIYNSAAGTGYGVGVAGSRAGHVVLNNVIEGFSGAGGEAIDIGAASGVGLMGYNAFYNNTANYTLGDLIHSDLTASDVILAASPFTDAASNDFSLTAAAKTALAAKGFPTSYLGAHANTVPNLNIGPIQMAASAGSAGGMLKAEKRGGKQ